MPMDDDGAEADDDDDGGNDDGIHAATDSRLSLPPQIQSVEQGGKKREVIVMMTRWNSRDYLSGFNSIWFYIVCASGVELIGNS